MVDLRTETIERLFFEQIKRITLNSDIKNSVKCSNTMMVYDKL